jgi:predicted metalloendopeptidase
MPDLRATSLAAAALFAVLAVAAPAAPADNAGVLQPIDRTVRPGDDFYRFANNPWLTSTTIPQGRPSYDSSAMLRDRNGPRVRDLIQSAAAAPQASSDPALAQKVGDYYAAWLDTAAIEAKGLAPLSADLAAIAAISDRDALSARLGTTLYPDDGTNSATEGVFGAWIHQGFHDPDHAVPHIVQGGLSLAAADYTDPAPDKAAERTAYKARIAAVLKLAGIADPDIAAVRVLALEIAIAGTHASDADTADVFKTDNAWSRADFSARAPGLNWNAYFKAAGLENQNAFVVWQPSAVIGTSDLVTTQSLETWKDYLAFHLIAHYAAVLPKAVGDSTASADRTADAIAATNAALGEGVGRLYVARYFPPEAKAAAALMVENIRAAYRARIETLAWMSPQTKQKALAKLAALKIGLGYPETWTDYSALVVTRGDAFGNFRRAEAFAWQQDLAKLHQPVNESEWAVLPQQVGAIILFMPNAEQFAAGVLQPPYFDPSGDAAANYGSAGAGLAHEVSHSFDELGNIYDAQGRLGLWWTPDDLAHYRAATATLAAQFAAYCPKPNLCLNGKQVSSEVVGDLTGLTIALDAYHLSLHGKKDTVIDGLTGDQRFFLAFAQRWRKLTTDAALEHQVAADTHPPGEYRADSVRNLDAWYAAFAVKPGDKLYLKPKDRIHVW